MQGCASLRTFGGDNDAPKGHTRRGLHAPEPPRPLAPQGTAFLRASAANRKNFVKASRQALDSMATENVPHRAIPCHPRKSPLTAAPLTPGGLLLHTGPDR